MAIFNRNKSNGSVPKEVKEYYQAQRRDRAGTAWVLAALSLLATIAVAVGLFYGGRWVWNRINDGDETIPTSQNEQAGESDTDSGAENEPDATDQQPDDNGEDQPADENTNDSPEDEEVVPTPAPVTDDTDDETTDRSDTEGSAEQRELANTGPAETIAAFLIVATLGTLGHSLYLRRKSASTLN